MSSFRRVSDLLQILCSSSSFLNRPGSSPKSRAQLVRRRVTIGMPLLTDAHIHAVNAVAVRGVGERGLQLLGVLLGLLQPFGNGRALALGLNHREFLVLINENIVGDVLLRPRARALDAADSNHLAPHPAARNRTPTGGFEGRVNQFGAGFGFVQCVLSPGFGVIPSVFSFALKHLTYCIL